MMSNFYTIIGNLLTNGGMNEEDAPTQAINGCEDELEELRHKEWPVFAFPFDECMDQGINIIIKNQLADLKSKIGKCTKDKFLSVLWIKNLDVLTTFAVNSDEVFDLLSSNKELGSLL